MTLARSPLPSAGQPVPQRRRRALVLVVAFGLLLTGAVLGVVAGLGFLDSGRPVVERCDALLTKTVVHSLAPDQTDNAALVTAVATHRGLPARAATIALATAFQESKLRNIDYGDRDSLGLFQQRPSQGWGTEQQVRDPVYATNAFYDVLVMVDGYEALSVTEAAQRVQRSAFPEAYAEHEQMARAFASALTGYSRASLTCRLRPASEEERAAATSSVLARLERDYGGVGATAREDGTVVVDARNLRSTSDEDELTRLAWGVAQWAVATADATGASTVATEGMVWRRADGRDAEWQPVAEADPAHTAPGLVVIA